MIIGQGMLALSFAERYADDREVLVFASGVSNSLENSPAAFERERRMLESELARGYRRSVYFGSCGVAIEAQSGTPYMRHKQAMESLVRSTPGGLVLRLPQVVGNTRNTNTLTNYLRDRILNGEHFHVWSRAERNLIDVADVAVISEAVIATDTGMPDMINIAADRSVPMPEIVGIFESVLERKANCTLEDKGSPLPIDSAHASSIARNLGLDLGAGYAERVIRKYYGKT